MHSYIQFVTTPTVDTPGTLLLLHFDSSRYLIGHIAEGTQRACIQRAIGLRKISNVLLTGRTEWSNTGGLLGLILTAADSKESAAEAVAQHEVQKARNRAKDHDDITPISPSSAATDRAEFRLNMHGAPNLEHTIATARRFVFRKGLPLRTKEYPAADFEPSNSLPITPTWADENIRVYVMPVLPCKSLNRSEQPLGNNSIHDALKTTESFSSVDIVDAPIDLPNKVNKASPVEGQYMGDESRQGRRSSQDTRHAEIRRAIVSDMFDSTWSLDALIETPLSDVQLPATLYVRNSVTKNLEEYHGPLPGGDEPVPQINVLVRKPWPSALIKDLPPTHPAPEAISYIIRNHPQRGRFLRQKANELGVKGVQCARLVNGEHVRNENGDLITPDMVLEPGREGTGIAVVDIPTLDYVEALIQRSEWKDTAVMDGVAAIVWILGPGVENDPRIQQFQQKWSRLQHMVTSPDSACNTLSLESAATSAIRHNMIDAEIFPVPIHETDDQNENGKRTTSIMARTGMGLLLEPRVEQLETELVAPFNLSNIKSELAAGVLPLKKEHSFPSTAALDSFAEWSSTIPSPDAEIIALGTGSALPSKYRNVSGTLVRVPGCGSYLFDCGENTLGTLRRLYSCSELRELLRDLKMIWISHLHADHHLGTTSVIKAWYHAVHNGIPAGISHLVSEQEFEKDGPKLAVVSDAPMLHWLYEYSSVEDYGYSRILPLASKPVDLNKAPSANSSVLQIATSATELSSQSVDMLLQDEDVSPITNDEVTPEMAATLKFLEILQLKDLATVRVSHCRGAQAISVTFKSGLKVSYSGDCRPSYEKFGSIGRDSHVLIHEATFEDELLGDAKAKKHSTVSEALGVARAMNARACVLTHFSQRYQKIPILNEEFNIITKNDSLYNGPERFDIPAKCDSGSQTSRLVSVVAFDYMRVRIRDLPRLENLQPLLNKVYSNLNTKEKSEEAGKEPQSKKKKTTQTQPQNKKQKKSQSTQEKQGTKPAQAIT